MIFYVMNINNQSYVAIADGLQIERDPLLDGSILGIRAPWRLGREPRVPASHGDCHAGCGDVKRSFARPIQGEGGAPAVMALSWPRRAGLAVEHL